MKLALWPLLLFAVLLSGCGGGGGSSRSSSSNGAAGTTELSGRVMLGPVVAADVTIHGLTGVLAESVSTDAGGHFGPIEISAEYSGPLLVEVSSDSDTQYLCDHFQGCISPSGVSVPFGEMVHFTGTLRLYLADAPTSSEPLTISLFTTVAADRADELGGLRVAAISQAHSEMQTLIESLTPSSISDVPTTPYYTVPFTNLVNPAEIPGEVFQPFQTFLAMLSTAPFASSPTGIPDRTVEMAIQEFAESFSETGVLQDIGLSAGQVTKQRLTRNLAYSLSNMSVSSAAEILFSLQGLSREELAQDVAALSETAAVFFASPNQQTIWISDNSIGLSPDIQIPVFLLENGVSQPLTAEEVEVTSSEDWLGVELVEGEDTVELQVTADPDILDALGNTIVRVHLIVDDPAQLISSYPIILDYRNSLSGLRLYSANLEVFEKSLSRVPLQTNRPNLEASFEIESITGSATASIDSGQLIVEAPSMEATDSPELSKVVVRATDTTGATDTAEFEVVAMAQPDISALQLANPYYGACLSNLLDSNQDIVDLGDVTSLDCSDFPIGLNHGLSEFASLRSFAFSPDDFVGDLSFAMQLDGLQELDLAGSRNIMCEQIRELQIRNPELQIQGDQNCLERTNIAIGGIVQSVLPVGDNLVVITHDRFEVVVISNEDYQVRFRSALPGSPMSLFKGLDSDIVYIAMDDSTDLVRLDTATLELEVLSTGIGVQNVSRISGVQEIGGGKAVIVAGRYLYSWNTSGSQPAELHQALSNDFYSGPMLSAYDPGLDVVYFYSRYLIAISVANDSFEEIKSVYIRSSNDAVFSADLTKLYTDYGSVVRLPSLVEQSLNASGAPELGNGQLLISANGRGYEINEWIILSLDSADNSIVGALPHGCDYPAQLSRLDNQSFVLSGGRVLCVLAPTEGPTYAPYTVADPVLSQCIEAHALAFYLENERLPREYDFHTLDCLEFPGIASIDGLDQYEVRELYLSDTLLKEFTSLRVQKLELSKSPDLEFLGPFLDLNELVLVDTPHVACSKLQSFETRGTQVTAPECRETNTLLLPGVVRDLSFSSDKSSAYVSIPALQQVLPIDVTQMQLEEPIELGANPAGVDLHNNGSTLGVALPEVSEVAFVDLPSRVVTTVSTQDAIPYPGDLAFVGEDQFAVTGNRDFGMIDAESTVTRIDNTVSYSQTQLQVNRSTQRIIELGSGRARVRDGSEVNWPIIDSYIRISGASWFFWDKPADHMYTDSGYKYDVSQWSLRGRIPGLTVSVVSIAEDRLAILTSTGALSIVDKETFNVIRVIGTDCAFQTTDGLFARLEVSADGETVFAFVDDKICSVAL